MSKSDSKAYVKETRVINQEYYDAVSAIIDNCNTMFQYSNNQLGELYRISTIVSFFASQKAYLDQLRQQFSEAKKNKDLASLRSVMYKIENNFECKTYDDLWSTIASTYDAMIESVRQENSNDDITATIKTAEEILENRRKYYIESNENKFADQIKTIEFILNL